MTAATISALHVYPVKGCRGIEVVRADLRETGLALADVGDREWMVVDPEGQLVTQREVPQLALVGLEATAQALLLQVPQHPVIALPLLPAGGAARDVVVWNSTVRGRDAGDEAAAALSTWLAAPVRLVRFDRAQPRLCNPDFAGDSGAHTLFADGYPLLVIGSASLAELNGRLTAQGVPALPMNRFRPNIVLDGLPAFDEDHLDTITIGEVVLRCVKPCTRCQVTTTDQTTAAVGAEPLRTLAAYRMNERLGGVTFGMNAIVVAGVGATLTRGATATVAYRF